MQTMRRNNKMMTKTQMRTSTGRLEVSTTRRRTADSGVTYMVTQRQPSVFYQSLVVSARLLSLDLSCINVLSTVRKEEFNTEEDRERRGRNVSCKRKSPLQFCAGPRSYKGFRFILSWKESTSGLV